MMHLEWMDFSFEEYRPFFQVLIMQVLKYLFPCLRIPFHVLFNSK